MARLLADENRLVKEGGRQFEMEGWIDTAPFEDLLGISIEELREGQAILSLPFTVKLAQGGGYLHGGALTALADTALALAIKSLLPENTVFATTELNSRFLAPVKQGRVTAAANVTLREGRTYKGQVVVMDEQDREVLQFEAVFRVARGQGIGE